MKKLIISLIIFLMVVVSFAAADYIDDKCQASFTYETMNGGDAVDIVTYLNNYTITPATQTNDYAKIGTNSTRCGGLTACDFKTPIINESIKSVTGWLYFDVMNKSLFRFDMYIGNSTRNVVWSVQNNNYKVRLYNAGWTDTTTYLSNETWHFFAITDLNNGNNKYDIWLDGVKIWDDFTMHNADFASGQGWRNENIGGVGASEYTAFDEISIFNESLNETEVLNIYNQGYGIGYPFKKSLNLTYPINTSNYNNYNGSIIFDISLPSVIHNCTLNDTRWDANPYEPICYQEFTNVSTACGGLDTGSYEFVGEFGSIVNPAKYGIDGNYNTYTVSYPVVGLNSSGAIYINYTKPDNVHRSSLWQLKYLTNGNPAINFTIPQNCFEYSNDWLLFRINSTIDILNDWITINATCYNGVTYSNIYYYNDTSLTFEPTPVIYEEGMYWRYNITEFTFQNNTEITGNNVTLTYTCQYDDTESSGTFWFYQDNTMYVSIYDQETNNIINYTTTYLSTIQGLNVNNYSSSSGMFNITNVIGGDLRFLYYADGYSVNNYYTTILGGTNYNFDLYLINNTNTATIQYIIRSASDQGPIDGAIVTLYENIGGVYTIVNQKETDFVGSVLFEQSESIEYIMQITKSGFITKTTEPFVPSTLNTPYNIFVSLDPSDATKNIFDFVLWDVYPNSGSVAAENLTINFTAQSESNSISYFNWSATFNGSSYGAVVTLAGGGLATDTIYINTSHAGETINAFFHIQYNDGTDLKDYYFTRSYYISDFTASGNVTLSDSIWAISDDIDKTQKNPALAKIVITILGISALIYILFRSGMDGKFAAALGILVLIPAAHFGFISWLYAILANLVFFFYIFVTTRDF